MKTIRVLAESLVWGLAAYVAANVFLDLQMIASWYLPM